MNTRSMRISWRMKAAAMGPSMPPRPPTRLTPPSTIAATPPSSVYGPGTGRPMPVVIVSDRPPAAQNRPVTAYARMRVRFNDDAAAQGGRPVTAHRVERQAEVRSGGWDRDDGDERQHHDQRPWQPFDEERAIREGHEPGRRTTARRIQHQQRGTGPDEAHGQRDHDVRDARDHDEEPVDGADQDVVALVAKVSNRAGDFARRLDHVLRLDSNKQDEIVLAFGQVSGKVSTPVLLQVMTHFKHRTNQPKLRTFFPKGNVAKAQAVENTLAALPKNVRVLLKFAKTPW